MLCLCQQGLGLRDGGDNIGATALFHFQYQCRLTINTGETKRIFKAGINGSDIGKGNHSIATDFDRDRQHIIQIFDNTRHFNGHPAGTGI